MLWVQFTICLLVILISGSRLAAYADIISEKTKFSAGLMGIFILASITSCPEIVTSLSSINIVNAPDLAAGDLLGADIFNMLSIATLAILYGKGTLLAKQSKANILTAGLTLLMLLVIIGFVGLDGLRNLQLKKLDISLGSIIIGVLYIGGIFLISKYETKAIKSNDSEKVSKLLIGKLIIAGIIIIIAGIWLARIGKNIADFYHWEEMYVGVLFIAFATTTPEFVVSFSALKRKSLYMATGNLLGSNSFNLFIIFILDLFFRKGNFFLRISKLNIFPASLAMVLTAIALLAMLKKPPRKMIFGYFTWDALLIIGTFFTGHYLLFSLASGVK